MSDARPTLRAQRREINRLLGELGTATRRRDAEKARQDEKIKKFKDLHGPKISAYEKQIAALKQELLALVLPNFIRLVKPGTKTIEVPQGTVRHGVASQDTLAFDDPEEVIIKRIRQRGGVRRFLRIKVEIDKVALKKDPAFIAKIRGLRLTRTQSIYIKPSKAEGSTVELSDPLKIVLPDEG